MTKEECKERILELSKYWDYERTDFDNNLVFRRMVNLFLSMDIGNNLALAQWAEWMTSWPRRLVEGTANPHPLTKRAIIKWIKESLEEKSS